MLAEEISRESAIRHITSALLKDQYRDKLVLHMHCNLDGSEAEEHWQCAGVGRCREEEVATAAP